MKKQPRTLVTHFRNSNFKYKMKTACPTKYCIRKILCTRKNFAYHEVAAVNLSKNYYLKNVKKTCKPNNRDLNRD